MFKDYTVSRKAVVNGITFNLVNRPGATEPMVRETLRHYFALVNCLKQGQRQATAPELAQRSDFGPMGDEPRVQVYGSVMVPHNGETLEVQINIFHEATLVQPVMDAIWLNLDVSHIQAQPAPQAPAQQQPNAAPPPAQAPQQPAPSAPPQAGVIVATRAPSPKKPQYAHGQMVQYGINKIELSTNNGVATYKLWGALGKQYPIATVYADNEHAMKAIGGTLGSLGLSLQRLTVSGEWVFVAQANHAPQGDGTTKEFMNPVSLTPQVMQPAGAPAQQPTAQPQAAGTPNW